MEAYSDDLRTRIVKAYEARRGSMRDLAFQFDVSLSFVRDLIRYYRDTGTVTPKSYLRGQKPRIGQELYPTLRDMVKNCNDATIQEYCDQFAELNGVRLGKTRMGMLLRKLGLTRKKKISTPQSKILPVYKRFERRTSPT